jgi:hypothetical protein
MRLESPISHWLNHTNQMGAKWGLGYAEALAISISSARGVT